MMRKKQTKRRTWPEQIENGPQLWHSVDQTSQPHKRHPNAQGWPTNDENRFWQQRDVFSLDRFLGPFRLFCNNIQQRFIVKNIYPAPQKQIKLSVFVAWIIGIPGTNYRYLWHDLCVKINIYRFFLTNHSQKHHFVIGI
jgi:hypothetical protein